MSFILDEFCSLDGRRYLVQDVKFSDNGDTFTLRYRRTDASAKADRKRRVNLDTLVVFPLDKVDVYVTEYRLPRGEDRFSLRVRTRGRLTTIQVNRHNFRGSVSLVWGIRNEGKLRALAKAFHHLTAVVAGRKELFQ